MKLPLRSAVNSKGECFLLDNDSKIMAKVNNIDNAEEIAKMINVYDKLKLQVFESAILLKEMIETPSACIGEYHIEILELISKAEEILNLRGERL